MLQKERERREREGQQREDGNMTLGLAFWIIMLIWFVFGLALHFGFVGAAYAIGGTLMLFILFLLLGWQVFGPPLHR
jgi:hypothetical protein